MSSRSVHSRKKITPIPYRMLPDTSKGRIPVIALDYKDRDLAQKKELVIDYETGNLYITSQDDDTVLVNLLETLANTYLSEINGNMTWVTISGIEGVVNLGEILRELELYKLNRLVEENEDTAIKGKLEAVNYDDKSIEEGSFVQSKDFDLANDLAFPRKGESGILEWVTPKEIGDPSEPIMGARKNIIDVYPTPREPDEKVLVLYNKPNIRSRIDVSGLYYVRFPLSVPTFSEMTWRIYISQEIYLKFETNLLWANDKIWVEPVSTYTEESKSSKVLNLYPDGTSKMDTNIIPNGTPLPNDSSFYLHFQTWDGGINWILDYNFTT